MFSFFFTLSSLLVSISPSLILPFPVYQLYSQNNAIRICPHPCKLIFFFCSPIKLIFFVEKISHRGNQKKNNSKRHKSIFYLFSNLQLSELLSWTLDCLLNKLFLYNLSSKLCLWPRQTKYGMEQLYFEQDTLQFISFSTNLTPVFSSTFFLFQSQM